MIGEGSSEDENCESDLEVNESYRQVYNERWEKIKQKEDQF